MFQCESWALEAVVGLDHILRPVTIECIVSDLIRYAADSEVQPVVLLRCCWKIVRDAAYSATCPGFCLWQALRAYMRAVELPLPAEHTSSALRLPLQLLREVGPD